MLNNIMLPGRFASGQCRVDCVSRMVDRREAPANHAFDQRWLAMRACPRYSLASLVNATFCMKDMEYIRIRDWPPDHAQEAYQKGYFVEAIQVLHGYIENQARGLLMLVGSVHFSANLSDTWDSVDEMPYKDVVKALLAVGQLTKQESADLLQINSVRNKMIHQIFKEPYEKIHHGFPKPEYDRVFQQAMRWAEKMSDKNEAIIE